MENKHGNWKVVASRINLEYVIVLKYIANIGFKKMFVHNYKN